MDLLAAAAAAAEPVLAPAAAPADEPHSPKHTRLPAVKRWSIVALHNDGRSHTYIAEHLQVDRRTVSRVLRRWRRAGDVKSGSRTGRPRETDEETDTKIALVGFVEKFTSPRQIKRKLDLSVSRITIDRRLQEAGLFGRVAQHKRDYSGDELRKRLAFAEGYKDWTAEQWSKVLFSDEKCFYGMGFCGRKWVRRPKGEALNPEYTVDQRAHPVKVNVWACFCAKGQGYMYCFNENMDAALMKHILEENLIPSAELHYSFAPPEQWYFLHDNDKKFRSNLVTKTLHELGVTTLDFPPYSPDLNPIENLWAIMARAVEARPAETVEELQDVIADEWDKVDKAILQKLADSMPRRCAAVIEAKGWHTKY